MERLTTRQGSQRRQGEDRQIGLAQAGGIVVARIVRPLPAAETEPEKLQPRCTERSTSADRGRNQDDGARNRTTATISDESAAAEFFTANKAIKAKMHRLAVIVDASHGK